MQNATALPAIGYACWNPPMLQGKDLAAAIRSALELKNAALPPGTRPLGSTALGKALGMAQSSASELLGTGRLAKEKLPGLLAFFEGVVGPDHFGLPITKFEASVLAQLRALPPGDQQTVLERLRDAADRVRAATADLDSIAQPAARKRRKAA